MPKTAPPKTMPLDLPDVTVSEYAGVRHLHLDSIWVQGSMRISKPLHLELEYVQRMMAPLLWQPPEAWRSGTCVQLGLGAGALTKFCHQVLQRPTTAVEIHPGVLAACRQMFELPHEAVGLTVALMDAAAWLRMPAHQGQVQLLHVDLYDHEAAAPVHDSAEFYAACHAVLAPGGAMSVNLFGRRASFSDSCERIAQAFGADAVWQLASTKEGNTVVVATRESALPDKAELQRRATNIESALGLKAQRWLRGLRAMTTPTA